MDNNNSSNTAIYGAITTTNKAMKGPDHGDFRKKKKRGPMHLLRVALYMLKLGNYKKRNSSPAHASWTNFVGSMRPLHVQTHDSPQPQLTATPPPLAPLPTSPISEHQEVFTPPMSPAQASTSSSSCGMSQYASVGNLQELDLIDESDEDENEDGLYGNDEGDEMIDVKAEQFIAQFYQQMRIQNQAYAHRRNKRVN